MGIYANYLGKEYSNEGREACLKAYKAEHKDIDKSNLKFYCKNTEEVEQLISDIDKPKNEMPETKAKLKSKINMLRNARRKKAVQK
jgi:hypothetical protein